MKYLKLIKENYYWLLIPAFLYLIFFILFPAFNIIDDGASLLSSRKLFTDQSLANWNNILIERDVGRLRPLYHLYFLVLYVLSGARPFMYWLFQAIVLGFTLSTTALFLFKRTKHYWFSGGMPLLLLMYLPTAENFFRLGTAEPRQMLVWLLMILMFDKVIDHKFSLNSTLKFAATYIVSLLLKESSIAFVSLILTYLVVNLLAIKKQRKAVFIFGVGMTLTTLAFLYCIPQGSYGSAYQVTPAAIWSNLLHARLDYAQILFPTVLMGISLTTRFLITLYQRKLKIKEYLWQILLLSQIVGFLLVGILPWQHQLSRYFYPIYLMSILFIGLEGFQLFKLFSARFKTIQIASVIGLSLLSVVSSLIQLLVFRTAFGLSLSPLGILERFRMFVFVEPHVAFLFALAVSSPIAKLLLQPKIFSKKLATKELTWLLLALTPSFIALVLTRLIWSQSDDRVEALVVLPLLIYLLSQLISWSLLVTGAHLQWKKWLYALGGSGVFLAVFITFLTVFKGRGLILTAFAREPIKTFSSSFDVHQVSYALISYLRSNIQPNTKVFVLADDYEIIYEIGLYASNLEQRSVRVFTSNRQLVDDLSGDHPFLVYSEDPVADYLQAIGPKVLLLRQVVLDAWYEPMHTQPISLKLRQDLDEMSFGSYRVLKLAPRYSFQTVPDWANWAVIQSAEIKN